MNQTMETYYGQAIYSGCVETLASAEIKFRKRGQKVCEIIDKLRAIREEYYKAAAELEKRRLDLVCKNVKTTYCKPRQSGKSKVRVEMTMEQLLGGLTMVQKIELLNALQEKQNAGK